LEDCLDAFIQSERLEGVDCSNCNQLRGMSKRLAIHVLPPTLAFHLKRFQSSSSSNSAAASGKSNGSSSGGSTMASSSSSSSVTNTVVQSKLEKNESTVAYPKDNLDLSRYVSIPCSCSAWQENKKCTCFTYNLRAVVQHTGQLAGGHYISFVRYDTPGDDEGLWFRFDDPFIHRVSTEEVLESEAYMLFYSRRDRTISSL